MEANQEITSPQPHETSISQLPIRITDTAPTITNLQHLNDDCLLEIFSAKSFELVDLCSLAQTCIRFQQLCQRVFPKELDIYILDDRFCVKSRNCVSSNEPLHNIEKILTNLGAIVEGISFSSCTVSSSERSEYLLNLVATYCVGTLKSLTIYDMKIPDILTVKLQPIFQRLKGFDISNGSMESGKLFTECDSLVDLRVCAVNNCNLILENTFPRLQRLSYKEYSTELNERLINFISRHKTLTSLDLHVVTDERFFRVINDSCKGLRKLGLTIFHRNACSLFSLQAMEWLETLMVRTCRDFKFLSKLTHLRELHLHNCYLPADHIQLANQFAQIIKLHIFQTYEPGSFDVILTVIRALKNLQELTVIDEPWNCFRLDEKIFSEIVDIVKGRQNVLLLKCKFNFAVNECDENRRVKLLRLGDQLFSESNFL